MTENNDKLIIRSLTFYLIIIIITMTNLKYIDDVVIELVNLVLYVYASFYYYSLCKDWINLNTDTE